MTDSLGCALHATFTFRTLEEKDGTWVTNTEQKNLWTTHFTVFSGIKLL